MVLRNFNLKRSSTIAQKTILCSNCGSNYTMQACVEIGIGCTSEHLCCILASPHVSGMTASRIPGSRRYFFGHRQTPMASLRHLTTVGTDKIVPVPFRRRVIPQLPHEHCLVKKRSFVDRCIEAACLCSDWATPYVWRLSMALQTLSNPRNVIRATRQRC